MLSSTKDTPQNISSENGTIVNKSDATRPSDT